MRTNWAAFQTAPKVGDPMFFGGWYTITALEHVVGVNQFRVETRKGLPHHSGGKARSFMGCMSCAK